MNQQAKNNLIDTLILLCAFVLCVSFPTSLLTDNFYIISGVHIGLLALDLAFSIWYIRAKTYLLVNRFKDLKILLWFIPVIVICFNNFIYLAFNPNDFFMPISMDFPFVFSFLSAVLTSVLTAILEEILFRQIIHNNLNINNRLLKVVASSAIFSLFHILNFFGSFSPYELIRVVYTFGLGLVIGLIFEYSHSIIACAIVHFLFNFINTDLYSIFAVSEYGMWFVLTSVIVSACVGIYLTLLYIFVLRKYE